MKDEHIEKVVEAGLAVVGALLLGGFGLLALGRVGGDLARRMRYSEGPPARGHVSPERHQQVGASSPR